MPDRHVLRHLGAVEQLREVESLGLPMRDDLEGVEVIGPTDEVFELVKPMAAINSRSSSAT